ncbi:MAG: tail fiber domain-containing protein, partial [Prolixibacteraceae bacterium]|nr:tail fiber domain-containing protein [Prolixibacteraceae bacterium]
TGNGTTTNPLGVTGDLTDDQTLSVSGDDLTISDGNTVTLPNNSKWNTGTYGISHTNSHVGIGADATDGSSLTVMNTIGNALFAGNNDAMNPPLQVYNQNANGAAAYFRNKIIIKDGTHGEGKVLTSDTNGNTSWQTPAVSSLWTPSGGNIVYSEGSVNVGGATPDSRILLQSSTSSNLYALGAINNGSNPTIYAMNNGTGPSAWIAGKVKITDGTESNGKVLTSDADGLASWQTPEESPWYHNTSGIQYTAGRVFVGSTTTNTANKLSISTMSDLHCMYAINSGNTRATLYAVNLGTGHAAEFRNKIKIVDGTEGEGKVLTSDAVGFTSWQTPATSSSLWTESGSNVYRSSGNVGIGTTSPTAALEISSSSAPSIIISSSTNNDPTRPGIQFKRNNSHFFSGDDVSDEAFGFYSIWASIRNYDAKLRVHGNASGSWGTYLELTHNGTDGIIKTDVGDVYISPATQKVGINTTSPTESLHVDGNARFEKIGSGAYFGVVNRTSDGTLTTASSDIRLKENIATLNNSLDKIMQLRGVSFTWKTNPEYGKRIGFIAQEFEQVIPELSFTNEVDGYKGINYAEVSVVLVEAVREQQKIIESLKTVNDQLKADNTEIINRLEKLETLISISAQK